MKAETLDIQLNSSPAELPPFRERLRGFLAATGLDTGVQESIVVAMGEAVTNSIRHSYLNEGGHKIRVQAEDQSDRVIFKIRDFGRRIDLTKLKTPTIPPEKPGGLGVYFMKTIMDELQYNTALPEGNELTLIKYKKGASSS